MSKDSTTSMPFLQLDSAISIAANIAHRCDNPRKVHDGWKACCPAHDDRKASLHIKTKAEKVSITCYARCDYKAILSALDLQPHDLRAQPGQPANGHKPHITQIYPYVDADGNLCHETLRYSDKSFKQRRPHPTRPGEHIWNLKGITPVLYHLPELLEGKRRGERIWIAEGEKDVESLEKLGLVATTNPMGAGSWRAQYSTYLRGADVVILPDNDDSGRKHAQMVTTSLDGVAKSVTTVALPELPEKGDVSDWIQAGGTREQLEALAQAVDVPIEAPRAHAVVISMEEVVERPIEWLWEPYVAIGKLCLLDGDPGTGKTGSASILMSAVSRGYPMPDQHGNPTIPTGEPGMVLIVAAEDDLEDTLKKRLRLTDADMSKIKVLNDIITTQGHRQHFTLEHLGLLEEEIQRYKPRLVYVDNLQLILGGKVDINRANQVNDILEGLISLAARYRFALICTRHPSKPGQNIARLIHRGMGSQAFMGRARLALYIEEHPLDPTKSLLVQSKSNAGGFGVTQIFSKAGGHFEWCGITRINATTMAGSGRGPHPHAFIEACLWLEEQLKDGYAKKADDLLDLALQEGIAKNTLYGAKKALNVRSVKDGEIWLWSLPPIAISSVSLTTWVTSVTSVSSAVEPRSASPTSQDDSPLTHVVEIVETEEIEETEVTVVATHQDVDASLITNLSPVSDSDDDFEALFGSTEKEACSAQELLDNHTVIEKAVATESGNHNETSGDQNGTRGISHLSDDDIAFLEILDGRRTPPIGLDTVYQSEVFSCYRCKSHFYRMDKAGNKLCVTCAPVSIAS